MQFKRLGKGWHQVEVAGHLFQCCRVYSCATTSKTALLQVLQGDKWRRVQDVWPERPLNAGGVMNNVRVRDVRAWLVDFREDTLTQVDPSTQADPSTSTDVQVGGP